MGSDSDLEVMNEAAEVLKEFGVGCELKVLSAHRTPDDVRSYVKRARERGTRVFICGAGGAAHLAGTVAAQTTLPVIGVPISSALLGLDSLDGAALRPFHHDDTFVPVDVRTLPGRLMRAGFGDPVVERWDPPLRPGPKVRFTATKPPAP